MESSLTKLATTFNRLGYDAVLLAEHDRGFDAARWDAYRAACAEASRESALLVPGLEYSDASNSVHVPVWGQIPFLGESVDTGELLQRVHDVSGLAILAHLGRRDVWRRVQPDWFRLLVGVELWNRKYDGYAPNEMAAALLGERTALLPFVSLDFHTTRQFHPLAMVLELDGFITEQGICDALSNGRAHPTAFGLPALTLASGTALPAMRRLERTRRSVAGSLRRVRGRKVGVLVER